MFILGCTRHMLGYRCSMSTTEEKLDSILKSPADIKQEHAADGQRDLRQKLEKLEKEVATGQEDTTQRVVKWLKEDQMLVFKRKGNERRFLFNDNIKDHWETHGFAGTDRSAEGSSTECEG